MEVLDSHQSPPPPPPNSASDAFNLLLASLPKKRTSEAAKFVKKLDDIPEISLPGEGPIQVALSLADRALVGQFTGLWPSPKSTEIWVSKNWAPLIMHSMSSYFLGRGYFLFEFADKEDKELIFRNGPYFMGPQGLYLNKWTPDFDPAVDVPTAVPVWVRLPNFPMHCWNWESLKHIGNTLGKFIDRANNKDQYDCARICVEVDLEVGLPEAIKIKVGNWSHIQKLDYEQLPFKCRKCHVYGHFARGCPSNVEAPKGKDEGWNQIKRSRTNKKNVGAQASKGPPSAGQQTQTPKEQGNKFEPLSLNSIELQDVEAQNDSLDKDTIPDPKQGVNTSSGSKGKNAEMEDMVQVSEESEEEGEIGDSQASTRRSTRGRIPEREKREQETYKDKLQGTHPTLEKMLEKSAKKTRNQSGSKGAQYSQKIK